MPDITNDDGSKRVLNLDVLPMPLITDHFHDSENSQLAEQFNTPLGSSQVQKVESMSKIEGEGRLCGSKTSMSRSLPSLSTEVEEDGTDSAAVDYNPPVRDEEDDEIFEEEEKKPDHPVIDVSPKALLELLKSKLREHLFFSFVAATMILSLIMHSRIFIGFAVGALSGTALTYYIMKLFSFTEPHPRSNPIISRADAIDYATSSVARIRKSDLIPDKAIIEAWMLEFFGEMNLRTFDFAKTKSIFVRLDGPILRIQRPKAEYVPKRAFHDEKTPVGPVFIHQRIIDMGNAEVGMRGWFIGNFQFILRSTSSRTTFPPNSVGRDAYQL